MATEDLKHYEQRLLEERKKVLEELDDLSDTIRKSPINPNGNEAGYSFHMADLGTDTMEREKAFLFASAEGRLLLQIDEALRRIYQNKFGTCEVCGESIAHERLDAIPYTQMCIECKRESELRQRSDYRLDY